ncbi:transposase [Acetobacter fabarum DSM 19596]|nr:transposase [Acetobacter fabarum DSM 19596]
MADHLPFKPPVALVVGRQGFDDEYIRFGRHRFSFLRFLGLGLSDRVPDAKTVWLFRERLTQASAIDSLFNRFDTPLRNTVNLPMLG